MLFREPSWWYNAKPSWQSKILAPISYLWDVYTTRRMSRPSIVKPALPVICVGNFTAGGTGKTPTSIFLAKKLIARGYKPIFLTRGYGGSSQLSRYVDKNKDTAGDVGDEPLLLASVAPVVIASKRSEGVKTILDSKQDLNIIIMDDGLQNNSIYKNISIAVVDGLRGFGNERVIPSGPLRASLDFQLNYIDLIIMNCGVEERNDTHLELYLKSKFKRQVYKAHAEPACDTEWVRGKRVLAYAGIANPDRFYKLLNQLGALVVEQKTFPDHHAFTDYDALSLIKKAEEEKSTLITTEKDWVRLPNSGGTLSKLKILSEYLPIKISIKMGRENDLIDRIESLISS